jgi:hypothetical protein
MFIIFIKLCVSMSSNYLVVEHEDNAAFNGVHH